MNWYKKALGEVVQFPRSMEQEENVDDILFEGILENSPFPLTDYCKKRLKGDDQDFKQIFLDMEILEKYQEAYGILKAGNKEVAFLVPSYENSKYDSVWEDIFKNRYMVSWIGDKPKVKTLKVDPKTRG